MTKKQVVFTVVVVVVLLLAAGIFWYMSKIKSTNIPPSDIIGQDIIEQENLNQKENGEKIEQSGWSTYEAENLGLKFDYFKKDRGFNEPHTEKNYVSYYYNSSLPGEEYTTVPFFELKTERIKDLDSCKNLISFNGTEPKSFVVNNLTAWEYADWQKGEVRRCLLAENGEVFYLDLKWLTDQYSKEIINQVLGSFEKTKKYVLDNLGYLPAITKLDNNGSVFFEDKNFGLSFEYWAGLGLPDISYMQFKKDLPNYGLVVTFPHQASFKIYSDDYAGSNPDLTPVIITKELKIGLDKTAAEEYFNEPGTLYYVKDLRYVDDIDINGKGGYKIFGDQTKAMSQNLINILLPDLFLGKKFNNLQAWIFPNNLKGNDYNEQEVKEIMENNDPMRSINILMRIIKTLKLGK